MKTNTEKFLYTRGLEKQVQSLKIELTTELFIRKKLEQSQKEVEFLKGEITHLKDFMKYSHEELEKAKETINMLTSGIYDES